MSVVAERKPWEPPVDPNSVRMYPKDPMKELHRLHRRAKAKVNGFGTFGFADMKMMEEVEAEIQKKLKRLAFLESKLEEINDDRSNSL